MTKTTKEKLLPIILKLKTFNHWKKATTLFWAFLLSLNTLALAYNNLQTETPIAGLKLDGQYLFGQSRTQLNDTVAQQLRRAGPVNFFYDNQKITISPKNVGLTVNLTDTVNRILATGRTGSPLRKFWDQERVLWGFLNIPLSGRLNPALLATKVLEIQDKLDVDPLPERPDFAGDLRKTLPASNGRKVDVDRLTKIVGENIDLPGERIFPLPVKIVSPHRHYTEQELGPIRSQAAKALGSKNIGLVAAGEKFYLSNNDLHSMLVLVERPNPKNPKDFVLELRLDSRILNNKLGDFAATVEAKNHAEFNFQYARVALFAQIFSGKPGPITITTFTTFNVASSQPKVLGTTTTAGSKVVYLTFDDGPDPIYHPLILDILKSQGVPATFFLIGQNAQKFPDLVKKTLTAGSINNHSLTHVFLPNISNSGTIAELTNTNNILRPLNGNAPIRLFRPPYGGTSAAIVSDALYLGMNQILWSVDPRDWSEPETSVLVHRVVSQTTNGSIILMHSNHRATVTALPQILTELKSRGFEFRLL